MRRVWYCEGCRRWVVVAHSHCPFCPPHASTVAASPTTLGFLLAFGALLGGCEPESVDTSDAEDTGSTSYDGYGPQSDAAAASYATTAWTWSDSANSDSTCGGSFCPDGDTTTGAESTTGDSSDDAGSDSSGSGSSDDESSSGSGSSESGDPS